MFKHHKILKNLAELWHKMDVQNDDVNRKLDMTFNIVNELESNISNAIEIVLTDYTRPVDEIDIIREACQQHTKHLSDINTAIDKKLQDFSRNFDKLDLMVKEFKGMVAMSRAGIKEDKKK